MKLLRPWRTWWPSRKEIQFSIFAPRRVEKRSCSRAPEENELVVQEALGGLQSEFRVVTPGSALQRILREDIALESVIDADEFFRTCPSVHGTDGFFAAAIERTAEKI